MNAKRKRSRRTLTTPTESACAGCGGCSYSGCRDAGADPAAAATAIESESCLIRFASLKKESQTNRTRSSMVSESETCPADRGRGLVHQRQPCTLPCLRRQLLLLPQREQREQLLPQA